MIIYDHLSVMERVFQYKGTVWNDCFYHFVLYVRCGHFLPSRARRRLPRRRRRRAGFGVQRPLSATSLPLGLTPQHAVVLRQGDRRHDRRPQRAVGQGHPGALFVLFGPPPLVDTWARFGQF